MYKREAQRAKISIGAARLHLLDGAFHGPACVPLRERRPSLVISSHEMSAATDLLVRAIAPTDELRIIAAVTTEVVRDAARRHQTSPPASAAIGRALTSGLLLATMTKGIERVTVQLVGDGPIGSVTVDANAAGDVRGFVRHPQARSDTRRIRAFLGDALGRDGVVNVTRDLGLRELYQGQVALTTGEIDEDVEAYLRISEQVPSALGCEVILDEEGQVVRAGGVLVQALPGGEPEAVREVQHLLRTGALYDLLVAGEVSAHELCERFSPSQPIEFLDDRAVRFQCRCSRRAFPQSAATTRST